MFKKRVASKMRFGSLPAPRRGNGRLIVQKQYEFIGIFNADN